MHYTFYKRLLILYLILTNPGYACCKTGKPSKVKFVRMNDGTSVKTINVVDLMAALQKEGKEITEECIEDNSRDKQKKKEVCKKTKNVCEEETDDEDDESDDEDEEDEVIDEDFFGREEPKIPCNCLDSNTCGVKILEEKCMTCECPDFGPEKQIHKCLPLNPLASPHCCSCEEVNKNVIGGLLSRVASKFVSKCRMYQEELQDQKDTKLCGNQGLQEKNNDDDGNDDDDDDFERFRRRKNVRKRRKRESDGKLRSMRRKEETKRRRTEVRRGRNGLKRGKHDKNLMKLGKNDLKRNKQLKYKSKLIRTYFSPLNIPRSI